MSDIKVKGLTKEQKQVQTKLEEQFNLYDFTITADLRKEMLILATFEDWGNDFEEMLVDVVEEIETVEEARVMWDGKGERVRQVNLWITFTDKEVKQGE